jgi:hypothetical protein
MKWRRLGWRGGGKMATDGEPTHGATVAEWEVDEQAGAIAGY